jgi:hypothetical protein
VFPYDVDARGARPILWPDFTRRFPLAARYLASRERLVRVAVVDHEHESDPRGLLLRRRLRTARHRST